METEEGQDSGLYALASESYYTFGSCPLNIFASIGFMQDSFKKEAASELLKYTDTFTKTGFLALTKAESEVAEAAGKSNVFCTCISTLTPSSVSKTDNNEYYEKIRTFLSYLFQGLLLITWKMLWENLMVGLSCWANLVR